MCKCRWKCTRPLRGLQSLKYLPPQTCINKLLLYGSVWSFHCCNSLWLDNESQAAVSGRFCWEEEVYLSGRLGQLCTYSASCLKLWWSPWLLMYWEGTGNSPWFHPLLWVRFWLIAFHTFSFSSYSTKEDGVISLRRGVGLVTQGAIAGKVGSWYFNSSCLTAPLCFSRKPVWSLEEQALNDMTSPRWGQMWAIWSHKEGQKT